MSGMMFAMLGYGVPAVIALLISAAYFFASPTSESIATRIAVSAPGIAIALLYFSVVFLSAHPAAAYGIPFMSSCLAAVLLVFFSLWKFKGRRILHVLQLFNVLALFLIFILGIGPITSYD